MKRILSALAAAAGIAALALGSAGTANAEEKDVPPPSIPFGLFINEVAAGPGLQDYIEITTAGAPVTIPVDLAVMATFTPAGAPQVLTTIPAGTVIFPGQVYTIANAAFTGCPPNQFFTVNLPENVPFRLALAERQTGIPGAIVDIASIAPVAQPGLPPNPALSQHRVSLTPSIFAPAPRTPCAPDMIPAASSTQG